ncbi:MAG TPA: ABC transporter permease [Gemmataceae bacterium]|nr:ABC transporter permease [Gemmataceae bacterium]
MSSKAITEKKDDAPQPLRWQTQVEVAPSALEDSAPLVSRWVGAVGLALVVMGGIALLTHLVGQGNRLIGPNLGGFLFLLGVGGLMYHAANDADQQIRRVYMGLGFLLLALGAGLSVLPMLVKGTPAASRFLPVGLPCFVGGLLFTMAFVRNETDAKLRDIAVYVIGGLGIVMALLGFVLGNIYPKTFLLPYGCLLILLGLFFLWAAVALRGGGGDDLGYLVGLGTGGLGLVAFLVALGRSLVPWLLFKFKLMESGYDEFLLPAGLLLMVGGLLYVAVGAGVCSDRQFVVLTRRELGAIFFSPLAYLVLVGYTLLGWYIYATFITALWQMDPTTGLGIPRSVMEPIVARYLLNWLPIMCVIMLVPVITMRLFSEEHRTGTLEMTFTTPVEEWVVVLSKFCAALAFFLIVWLPWGLYLIDLRAEGGSEFDYRPLLGFGVALLFNGAGFVSMGLFFSSLTRNQLIAAVFTFVGMFFLLAVFWVKDLYFVPDALQTALEHLSFVDMWFNAIQGKLATRDIIVYASAAVFWLFLTVKVLESRKWR